MNISLKKDAVVTEDYRKLMKFLPGKSNSRIHSIHATTLANHITMITKLGYLLKLNIKKLYVQLCNRWWRKLVNAVLTNKIGILLERMVYTGAFFTNPLLTLSIENRISAYTWSISTTLQIYFFTLPSWYLQSMIFIFFALIFKPWLSRLFLD